MTNEEIRALLDGPTAPLSQESAVTRLQAAAPGLACEVLRLRAKLDVLRSHRDRLDAEARSLDPCWETAHVLTYEEVVDLLDAVLSETP